MIAVPEPRQQPDEEPQHYGLNASQRRSLRLFNRSEAVTTFILFGIFSIVLGVISVATDGASPETISPIVFGSAAVSVGVALIIKYWKTRRGNAHESE